MIVTSRARSETHELLGSALSAVFCWSNVSEKLLSRAGLSFANLRCGMKASDFVVSSDRITNYWAYWATETVGNNVRWAPSKHKLEIHQLIWNLRWTWSSKRFCCSGQGIGQFMSSDGSILCWKGVIFEFALKQFTYANLDLKRIIEEELNWSKSPASAPVAYALLS